MSKDNLTVRIDIDLHKAFSAACKANDTTASQVLRAAVRDYLAANSQPSLSLKGK